MPCENYREALIEAAAAGNAPARELRLHRDSCASCRASFDEERQLFAAIDADLRAAVNSEMPPAFFARVRAHLDIAATPRPRWMPSLIFASAAVAVVFLLLVAIHALHTPGKDLVRQLPVALLTTPSRETPAVPGRQDAAGLPARAASHPNRVPALRNAGALHGAASTSIQLEVIVPPDERQGLTHFIATMQEGRDLTVAPAPNMKDERMSMPLLQIAELEVQPLEMDKSDVPDSKKEKQ
ncbi:MAG: hypothetical protein ABSH39_03355 [Candidatus Acidiferrum sp.]|jgi:hypothetical protein